MLYTNEKLDEIGKILNYSNKFKTKNIVEFYYNLLVEFNKFKSLYTKVKINSNDKEKFVISIPVWGENYFEMLVGYSLPALFTHNNAEVFIKSYNIEILISTDLQTKEKIEKSELYKLNYDKYKFIFHIIPNILFESRFKDVLGNKIALMSYAHRCAVYHSKINNSGIIFIAPDMVISDHYLSKVDEILKKNKKIIFCHNLGIDKRKIMNNELIKSHKSNNLLKLNKTEIDKLINELYNIENIYDMTGNGIRTSWPWKIIYQDKSNYVVHASYHHPFLVKHDIIEKICNNPCFSNDSGFVYKIDKVINGDYSKIHLIDGKEITSFTLEDLDDKSIISLPYGKQLSSKEIATWNLKQQKICRWFIKMPIYFGQIKKFENENKRIEKINEIVSIIDKSKIKNKYLSGYDIKSTPKIFP